MLLDVIAALLMWIAIRVEPRKKENTGSSLDNFGLAVLQGALVAAAFIIMKSNPFQ